MKMTVFILVLAMFFSTSIECRQNKTKNPDSLIELRNSLLKNKQHLDLINFLIAQSGYKSYLEIGIADGANLRSVRVEHKIGVDPSTCAPSDYQITSDEFFRINDKTFDIIFIDGLHICEQVLRDVDNSLKCLNPGGIIVMHDCLPETPQQQYRVPVIGAWNGDVWKAAAYIRMHFKDVHFCVLDMDWGCGILTPNSSQNLYPAVPIERLDWAYYIQNKHNLLNIVKVEDWVKSFQ